MNQKIKQLRHTEVHNVIKKFPLVVLCENFLSPENVGMTFRVCETMGVTNLYLCGGTPAPPNRKLTKAARSAHEKVPYIVQSDTTALLQQLKQAGYTLIGLEITNQSKDIRTYDFQSLDKIAFVAGAERYGISETVLTALDATVHIPMFGIGTSMNVVTALSIGLYEITKQWNLK